jgi:hypothetical protein
MNQQYYEIQLSVWGSFPIEVCTLNYTSRCLIEKYAIAFSSYEKALAVGDSLLENLIIKAEILGELSPYLVPERKVIKLSWKDLANLELKYEVNQDWFTDLCDRHKEHLTVIQMSVIVHHIHNLMGDHNYPLLNKIINLINEDSSIEFIIICLRTTYSVRDKLESWDGCLKQASKYIKDIGENPDSHLQGLL